jgi:hypothetical protein
VIAGGGAFPARWLPANSFALELGDGDTTPAPIRRASGRTDMPRTLRSSDHAFGERGKKVKWNSNRLIVPGV